MDKSKKYIAIAFIAVLILVIIITTIGILTLDNQLEPIQGQVEATEIRISGKILGRIDHYYVKEGQNVQKGDTLVLINSPEAQAKYNQVNALGEVAIYENQKVKEGTRSEITETARQLWIKTKSDLDLAQVTYYRIENLYRDSVVTEQHRDETYALYRAAQAAERAAFQQYQMAIEGPRVEDRRSSQSMVNAAKSTVEEIGYLLDDTRLIAPENGQIAVIYPKRGELVAPGTPIMTLIVIEDTYVTLNIREDLMPHFRIGSLFKGNIPALNQQEIQFEIYYISPLGSYATWKSTKESDSYDMRTFEIKARPAKPVEGMRPGMTVLVNPEI